ncbi:hypothetical protein, partial [Vibrio sp. 10N.222.49.C9]
HQKGKRQDLTLRTISSKRQKTRLDPTYANADMRQVKRQRNRIDKSLAQAEALGLMVTDIKGRLGW